MKKELRQSLVLALVTLSFFGMSAAFYVPYSPVAVFEWDSTTYDFGVIELNQPAEHTFSFKNMGDAPLIIQSVKASCGCTVANYSMEPIGVGEDGFVKATYNSAKPGHFVKTVTVIANTGEDAVTLTLKGEVLASE